jgi:hypothetical protein
MQAVVQSIEQFFLSGASKVWNWADSTRRIGFRPERNGRIQAFIGSEQIVFQPSATALGEQFRKLA